MLVVAPSGSRKWVLRYQLNGKRRDMGLGSFPEIGLASARLAAASARALAAQGVDPVSSRQETQKKAKRIPTFAEIAETVIADAQSKTTNAKVAYQIARHLGPVYSGPLLNRAINEITTVDVAAVLRPVWTKKPEVARKLYPAIRRVFEHARIRLRDEHGIIIDNPARWDDLKAMQFSAPQQLSRGHHASLPYKRIPEFIAALHQRDAIAARLLEFLILTNVRTGAALAAKWNEIDFDTAVWSVPVVNLKDKAVRKEPFRVPLSPRAIEILRGMLAARVSEYVFPGSRGTPLSNMAMLILLKRMRSGGEQWLDDVTGKPCVPHGFRATFRTWAEDETHFPNAVVEEAMGHAIGNAVERAYRRTDVLEKRRELMNAWAAVCGQATTKQSDEI